MKPFTEKAAIWRGHCYLIMNIVYITKWMWQQEHKNL